MKLVKSLIATLLAVLLICTMCVSAFAYNDVSMEDETMPSIEYVDRLGILPSSWNNDFRPEQYLSRADAVVAAYRMLYGADIDPTLYEGVTLDFVAAGETGDIEEDSVLVAYLAWAVDNYLITTNVEGSKFKPAEAITMNEFIALMAKIMGLISSSEATYPDDYVDAIGEIAGEYESGEAPVTRKQAAVIMANAIVADVQDGSATAMAIGEYTDFDGNPTNSLAVKVFHMSSVDLVIRATKNKTLGYTVKNGTLLSNGADVDLGSDLTDYVGYGISVTYRDADNSGTYTEDEEVLTYSIGSTICATISVENLSISSGNMMSVTTEAGTFTVTTATYVYLNDNPWPLDDVKYDLTKLIAAIGKVSNISNRSNLKFKCMAANAEAQALITMFGTEQKPGKVVGINKGYYSIFDYYYAGTDDEIKVYYISDCVFSTPVKVGDYINFYEADGKVYCNEGTTLVASVNDIEDNGLFLTNGTEVIKHAFYRPGDVALKTDGTEYLLVLDDSGANLLITWEAIRSNYQQFKITAITSSDDKSEHSITGKDIKSGESKTFTVKYDNVDSTTALTVGDFIDYSEGTGDKPVVYVKKTSPVTIEVAEVTDTYVAEAGTGKKYYFNAAYVDDGSGFTSGTATLMLDMANTVVEIIHG